MWDIDDLARRFDRPVTIDAGADRKRASVALILRPSKPGGHSVSSSAANKLSNASAAVPNRARPSVLVIERASREGDPWSSHMAFPGGRNDPSDDDLLYTAIRETQEETGLELERQNVVGQLHDIDGRHSGLIVSCFVFEYHQDAALRLNHEVASAFWVSFDQLLDPESLIEFRPPGERWNEDFPGIRVGTKPNHVIWGLTYRLLCDFVSRLDEMALPVHIPPDS